LRRVAERFPEELVVIGVHSPKFDAEKETPALEAAVERHGIRHPVVNDRDFAIWQAYGARAWPTVVLVDPQGYVLAQTAGEVDAVEVIAQLETWVAEYRQRGALTAEPMPFVMRPAAAPAGLLAFPAKVAVDGDRAWVADTEHHRVVELALLYGATRARLVRVFGRGDEGFDDGAAERASFRRPHGLSRAGDALYVADTDNHALRAIDLGSGEVRTLAGTGEKARGLVDPGDDPRGVALRSPWDVLAVEEDLVLVAMAGSHQIWALVEGRELKIVAGTGREALVDGPAASACFNQPSGLAMAGPYLFVADAEASAIRALTFAEDGVRVSTVVGRGLFEFGDVDGKGDDVRLQHTTGIAWSVPYIYLTDTYNDKVKRLDPSTLEVTTLAGGSGVLAQPEGLAAGDGFLLVADTNLHRIRRVDLVDGRVATLEIESGG
jgi:DNA-binding beta-propeller fold protein YncE